MSPNARSSRPNLRIDIESVDERSPLMGGKNGKPQIQIERPTPTPKSAKSFKAKSRTDTDGSLEAQVHAPAIDEVFAMPATQQVAADYAEPVSACSFDGALRHQDDGPEKTAQAASGLPRVQILLLCYCRMIEPIMFFCIFPFVNKMIWETGDIAEGHVGFYAGLIESLFSITQMVLMIPWGHAADRFGRKPVLYISLFGSGFATMLFGFSKSVWQMVLFRCIAGCFAGSVVTIRAMFSENSTPKTQARAFSLFSVSGHVGILLGPLIGGILSDPADQFPHWFGQVVFFRQFPYALTSIVAGMFSVGAAIGTIMFIKETLRPKDHIEMAAKPISTKTLLEKPRVRLSLYIYTHTWMLAFAYTAVVPTFWWTSPDAGGYGFDPLQISLYLATAGVLQGLWTLFVFPKLHQKIGTRRILIMCFCLWPLNFLGNALGNYFRRNNIEGAFWFMVVFQAVLGSFVAMAYTAVQLALNDAAPTHGTLGSLNAIALALSSGSRAITPATFASVFAIGVSNQILHGQFIWVVMAVLAAVLAFMATKLPEEHLDKDERQPDVEQPEES